MSIDLALRRPPLLRSLGEGGELRGLRNHIPLPHPTTNATQPSIVGAAHGNVDRTLVRWYVRVFVNRVLTTNTPSRNSRNTLVANRDSSRDSASGT